MINFRFIANLMGRLLMIESGFLLLCTCIALLYGESDALAFFYTCAITATAGLLLTNLVKTQDRILAKKDGYFMVSMVWIVFSLFGCLPYLFGHTISSFPEAFFETMSGFTTTGLTVLQDLESLPHATLFWRSLTQWLGGLGIIMLFIAILSSLGIEGRDLYVAEVPSPTHSKTSFTFTSSARKMWILYTLLTLLQTLLLLFGGMDFFDGICHSFATMATGGFTTKASGIAHWDSAYIQYVLIIFMFIAGTNFGLLSLAFKGNWSKLTEDNEFRIYVGIILIASFFIGSELYLNHWSDGEQSIRNALFQVVSLITTTGYVTTDYQAWPSFLYLILCFLFFTGASSGSTSGGLKIMRVYLLFKNSLIELKRIIHPNGIINVKYNKKTVHPNIMSGIMGFAILFIVVFAISSAIMTLFTENIATACSMVISSISNVGAPFGNIGPDYSFAALNNSAKLFLAFLMLVGRLEILTVMVLFTPAFWKR